MERRTTDEEPELGLPPPDGDDEEESGSGPPVGDGDLDLDTLGQGEEVGLDAANGTDDHYDPSELIGSSDKDEVEKWTPDSEAAEDLAGAEPDLFEGEEEGWTEESESPQDEEHPLEGIVSLPPDSSQEDGGEEGVDEKELREGPHEGEDETELPPLDPDGRTEAEETDDEEEEAFGRRLLDELADKEILDE
jgi:hypothetical protein